MFSTNNHLRLVELQPTNFAGINNANPEDQSLVITFPLDKNAMIIEGDQGTKKTSLLEALKFMFTGDAPENAINSITKDKNVRGIYVSPDGNTKYIIKATRTGFSISKEELKDGTVEKSIVTSPKNWLRDKIGNVGIDPSFLKRMKPEDQIEWIRELVKLDDTKKKEEKDIRLAIKSAYDKRKNVNKEIRSKKTFLTGSGYFRVDRLDKKKIVKTEKLDLDKNKYQVSIDDKQKDISDKFDTALKLKNNFDQLTIQLDGPTGLKQQMVGLNDKEREINAQIKKLQDELIEIDSLKVKGKEAIANTEEQLLKLSGAHEYLDTARKEMDDIRMYIIEKTNFEGIEKTQQDYVQLLSSWEEFDKLISEKDDELRKFILTITPNIPGIEICIPQDVNVEDELAAFKDENEEATPEQIAAKEKELNDKNRSGIYYQGHPLLELCESELWGFCTLVWEIQQVPVIFIENVSSLGSDAIATLNRFMSNGGQVYATKMNRELKKMTISFSDKID